MSRIIVLANQKGGCAKTTTAVNLAAGLSLKNKKVLLIDVDPQANATSVFADLDTIDKTISNLLFDKTSIDKIIISTSLKNLFLLPSDIDLSAADLKLAEIMGREKLLHNRIKDIADNYDYIIIDSPPSLGLLTVNALTTANEVIIPISTSFFAMKGVKLLEDTINLIRENLEHPKLKISSVICTMYDPITNVSKNAHQMIQKYFKNLVLKTVIRKNIKLEEAHSDRKSIFEYAPDSIGAEDYKNLVEEVLNEPKNRNANKSAFSKNR